MDLYLEITERYEKICNYCMYDFVRYNLAISHQNDVAFNRKIHLKAFNGWKNNFSYDADFLFLGTFDVQILEFYIVLEW